jgi:hypothetical protein
MAATRDEQATWARAAIRSGAVSVLTGSEDCFVEIGQHDDLRRTAVALPVGEGVTR